ncbi:hypothetical protein J1614_004768 [Plenodomus biglobosus]|nr:hypothetical protein J1614_004768 [Plenodomus biglobosus]
MSSLRSLEHMGEDEMTARISNLLAKKKRLERRCEELGVQSHLNRDMFLQCFKALTNEQYECSQLRDANNLHLRLIEELEAANGSAATSPGVIAGYEAEIRLLHEQLQSARVDTEQLAQQVKVQGQKIRTLHAMCTSLRVHLETQQKTNEKLQDQVMSTQTEGKDLQGLSSDNTQHIQALELQIKALKTQLSKANEKAVERESLMSQFEEQLKQLMPVVSLHGANKEADHMDFNAKARLQQKHILELQGELDAIKESANKCTACRIPVADIGDQDYGLHCLFIEEA